MPESSALPLMCPFGWYAADSAIFRFGHPIYGTRSAAHPIPWHTRNAGPRQRQVLLDRNKGIEVSHDYSGRVSSGGIARFITNLMKHALRREELYIKFEKGLDEDSFEVLDSKAYLWS